MRHIEKLMKLKNINKILNYINPFYWINRRKNRERYLIVLAAKHYFINNRDANHITGLCYCFNRIINEYTDKDKFNITDIIPEFNRKFLNAKNLTDPWWWDTSDYQSRIKAFNKLLDYYKSKM